MKILFDHKTEDSDEIFSFYFSHQELIEFTPGQFIELKVVHDNPDSRGDSRYFTLSSSPLDKNISITTRITKNSSSYKKALLNMKPGTVLNITSPMGDFVLPKIIQTPLVFIAGGIGITPYLSIAKFLHQTKESRNIHLFYSVKNESEIIFGNLFENLKIHSTVVVSNPSDSWGGERGHLTVNMILEIVKNTPDTIYYLSGPKSIVENLSQSLATSIEDRRQIVTDFFPGYI